MVPALAAVPFTDQMTKPHPSNLAQPASKMQNRMRARPKTDKIPLMMPRSLLILRFIPQECTMHGKFWLVFLVSMKML